MFPLSVRSAFGRLFSITWLSNPHLAPSCVFFLTLTRKPNPPQAFQGKIIDEGLRGCWLVWLSLFFFPSAFYCGAVHLAFSHLVFVFLHVHSPHSPFFIWDRVFSLRSNRLIDRYCVAFRFFLANFPCPAPCHLGVHIFRLLSSVLLFSFCFFCFSFISLYPRSLIGFVYFSVGQSVAHALVLLCTVPLFLAFATRSKSTASCVGGNPCAPDGKPFPRAWHDACVQGSPLELRGGHVCRVDEEGLRLEPGDQHRRRQLLREAGDDGSVRQTTGVS